LATLPGHRGAGLGRAVMSHGMAHRPGRTFTLVATDAGRPLYESMNFATVSTAAWYTRRAVTTATGEAARPPVDGRRT
jgi:predicted N-acetyltransferase YhbS